MSARRMLVAALLPLLAGAGAHAEDIDLARERFQRALDLSRENRHGEALVEYEVAWAAAPRPNTIYNMGRELQALGESGRAVACYRRYLQLRRDAPDRGDVTGTILALGGDARAPTKAIDAHRFPTPLRTLGSERFSDDATILARTVVIRAGAHIQVAPGKSLRIYAGRFVIEGAASIDGRGSDGEAGVGGAPRPIWDTDDADDWRASCHSEVDAGNTGGPGGDGGAGARVEIRYESLEGARGDLKVDVSGGLAGAGGPGGPPRLCRGPDRTRQQKYGPAPGAIGAPGRPGSDGKFTLRPL